MKNNNMESDQCLHWQNIEWWRRMINLFIISAVIGLFSCDRSFNPEAYETALIINGRIKNSDNLPYFKETPSFEEFNHWVQDTIFYAACELYRNIPIDQNYKLWEDSLKIKDAQVYINYQVSHQEKMDWEDWILGYYKVLNSIRNPENVKFAITGNTGNGTISGWTIVPEALEISYPQNGDSLALDNIHVRGFDELELINVTGKSYFEGSTFNFSDGFLEAKSSYSMFEIFDNGLSSLDPGWYLIIFTRYDNNYFDLQFGDTKVDVEGGYGGVFSSNSTKLYFYLTEKIYKN